MAIIEEHMKTVEKQIKHLELDLVNPYLSVAGVMVLNEAIKQKRRILNHMNHIRKFESEEYKCQENN